MSDSSLSPQLHFLIKASLGGRVNDILVPEFDTITNWDLVYDLSQDHQISALLYSFLESSFKGEVPSVHLEDLKKHSTDQAVFNMLFLRKSIALYADLVDNGVDAFLMKGAVWAWLLYENPGLREFGDIDFFLKREQINDGLRVLSAHNFEPDGYRKYLLNSEKVGKLYFDTDYQLPLIPIADDMIQSLEIQWNTTYPRYHYSFTWKELTDSMVPFEVSGSSLLIPGPESQLLMMIIHHGGVEQWDKLKYMADLIRLLRKYGNHIKWEEVIDKTKQKGFYKIFLQSLGLIYIFTGENYLTFCGKNLEKQYPSKQFYKKVISHWENTRARPVTKSWRIFYFNMIYRDRLSDKFSILFSHLAYLFEWRLIVSKTRWYRKMP